MVSLAAACLKTAELEGRVLIVVNADDDNSGNVHKAFRNIARSAFSYDRSLNVHDLLLADAVVFTDKALEGFTKSREASA
jgi:ribosomal protein L4